MDIEQIRQGVEAAWDGAIPLDQAKEAVEGAIDLLDQGRLRSAEPSPSGWSVNQWAKKAIILYRKIRGVGTIEVGPFEFNDNRPLKHGYLLANVRVVPPGAVRHGSYLGEGVVVMPSFINIGAWVGPRTMIGIGASVGSCAQVGADVFVSSGARIGSILVLPLAASPVIVEDGVFIGSHCVLSESTDPYYAEPAFTGVGGVLIGARAVLGANVVINGSTSIIDATGSKAREFRGVVPPNAVVVAGTTRRRLPAGEFQVAAAIIVGWRSEDSDLQTSLNEALRTNGIAP
jgi:2,3,4,5-tetrahydropyridine-2-carboxylate N-succinyltransferase